MIIAIVLSSLALLAATAGMILTIRERKRSQKRNTAMVRYVERTASDTLAKAKAETERAVAEAVGALQTEFDRRIRNLEDGVVPDFEKAKAAAKAVNDFNDGIANIMGFDPIASLKQQRDGNVGGDKG